MGSAFRPFISIVSVGEMLAFAKNFGERRQEMLQVALNEFVIIDLMIGSIVDEYAALHHFTKTTGLPMPQNDLWIAATAITTGATLITADQDFVRLPEQNFNLILVNAKTGATEVRRSD